MVIKNTYKKLPLFEEKQKKQTKITVALHLHGLRKLTKLYFLTQGHNYIKNTIEAPVNKI